MAPVSAASVRFKLADFPQGTYGDVLALVACCLAVGFVLGAAPHLTVYMWLAALAFALLCAGFFLRHNRRVHPWLMLAGIGIDLSLVGVLQISRNAIGTALSFTLSPLQQAHIATSSVATVLYFPVLYLGWKLWQRTNPATRALHTRVSLTALVFRTLGFFLMFSLVLLRHSR